MLPPVRRARRRTTITAIFGASTTIVTTWARWLTNIRADPNGWKNSNVDKILAKYFFKKTDIPRNSPYTLELDEFYRIKYTWPWNELTRKSNFCHRKWWKRVIRVQNQILAVVFAVCFNSVLRVVRPCWRDLFYSATSAPPTISATRATINACTAGIWVSCHRSSGG